MINQELSALQNANLQDTASIISVSRLLTFGKHRFWHNVLEKNSSWSETLDSAYCR